MMSFAPCEPEVGEIAAHRHLLPEFRIREGFPQRAPKSFFRLGWIAT